MKLCASIAVLVLICLDVVSAQNFESAISKIAPSGVRLGLNVEELKATRPDVYQGPSAAMPGSPQADFKQFATFMEVQGMGQPGHVSYWYLLSQNQVVGVLKTTNLVGIDDEARGTSAQSLFRELTSLLGGSQQESIIRKGGTAFVPVRSDVWKDSESGRAIYFIATDKEITVAALAQSNFPIEQVFIRPNAERFPLENPAEASIRDLDRPNLDKSPITQRSAQAHGNPDVQFTPSAKARTTDQLAKQPSASGGVIEEQNKQRSFPLILVFGAVVLAALALAAFYYKRRS